MFVLSLSSDQILLNLYKGLFMNEINSNDIHKLKDQMNAISQRLYKCNKKGIK